MKKIGLVFTFALAALLAQASDYAYLVFTNTAGTNTALSVANLSMTINGNTLTVTNDDGTTEFTLTDLAAMEFSVDGETLAFENVLNGALPVSVYTLSGTSMGVFDNLLRAVGSLGKGAYVIKQGNNSQTIILK